MNVESTALVDRKGKKILLQGTHLAGWLYAARWLGSWKKPERESDGESDRELNEFTLWPLLARRFSEEEVRQLRKTYRDSWITPEDLSTIRRLGFNTVRVPFSLSLLPGWNGHEENGCENDGREDSGHNDDSLQRLDNLVQQTAHLNLYCILDLHIQQRQFWSDETVQQQVVGLWKNLSRRYTGSEHLLFDFLNEPTYDGYKKPTVRTLFAYYKKLHDTLREQGDQHLFILQDGFKGLECLEKEKLTPEELGLEKVIYSLHWYPREEKMEKHFSTIIPRWQSIQQRLNVPLLVGEFSTAMHFRRKPYQSMRRYLQEFNERNWSWCLYTYKRVGRDAWSLYQQRYQQRNHSSLDLQHDPYEKIRKEFSSYGFETFILNRPYEELLRKVLQHE